MLQFKKEERLSSKKTILALHKSGSSLLLYPILFHYMDANLSMPIGKSQVCFGVSSKKYKLAVTRNKYKRLMREAYRLEKPLFYEQLLIANKSLFLFINFIGKKPPMFEQLQFAMHKGLGKILSECSKNA